MNGWIRLDRKIQDHFIWQDSGALKLWIYLLMAASLTDKTVSFNGTTIQIKRGQLVFGLNAVSQKLGLTMRASRKYIEWFLNDGMIDRQITNKYSIISITNFAEYQDCGKQTTSKRQATDKLATTTIQVTSNNKQFKPPKVEEVEAYCRERGNSIKADEFVSYYAARGWSMGNSKMKDWKAAMRTWESRRKASLPKKTDWEVEL